MNQQQVQQQPAQMNPGNVQQIVQPLIQALGMIAATQQRILTQLEGGVPKSEVVAGVPEFPIHGRPVDKYMWFYNHGLYYNLDRTRRRVQVTVADMEEHEQFLGAYWDNYVK